MSSQPPSASIPSKATASSSKSNSSSQPSPAVSQTQQFFASNLGSRTAGPNSNTKSAAPRNTQAVKPKHKQGKKFQVLDEDERIAMHNVGRRGKTADITHLMNIALPPRPQNNNRHSYNGPRRTGRFNAVFGLGSGYHAVDKARYART